MRRSRQAQFLGFLRHADGHVMLVFYVNTLWALSSLHDELKAFNEHVVVLSPYEELTSGDFQSSFCRSARERNDCLSYAREQYTEHSGVAANQFWWGDEWQDGEDQGASLAAGAEGPGKPGGQGVAGPLTGP